MAAKAATGVWQQQQQRHSRWRIVCRLRSSAGVRRRELDQCIRRLLSAFRSSSLESKTRQPTSNSIGDLPRRRRHRSLPARACSVQFWTQKRSLTCNLDEFVFRTECGRGGQARRARRQGLKRYHGDLRGSKCHTDREHLLAILEFRLPNESVRCICGDNVAFHRRSAALSVTGVEAEEIEGKRVL